MGGAGRGAWAGFRAGAFAVVAAAAAALAVPASPARAEEHKDERLGYSVQFPKKWNKRPVASDERWVVAKFESDREFEASDPKGNFWLRHRPYLDVVVIPLSLEDRKGGTVSKDETGKVKVTLAAPWTDLKEYLEKNLSGSEGGFFFSQEEEATVNGLKVMQYEVTIEKLVDQPKKVWGWAWYTEDAIYGIVGESLIRFEDKVKPDLLACMKSFKAFPRKGVLPGAEHTGEDVVVVDRDEDVDDDTLQRRREEAATRRLIRIKETLASDWTVKESKNFVAVSHSDAKYTKSVLDHAEALRGWLDENLGFVGSGYCGRVIIRVCADRDEYEAFTKTGGWSPERVEVTTYKDKEGWNEGQMTSLNYGIWSIWSRDRNQTLAWSSPAWISGGLSDLIGTAVSKGSKIEFRPSTWDKVQMATMRRDGKLLQAKSFFTMTSDTLWGEWANHQQASVFVRFLVVGGARKSAKFKGLFADYMRALVFEVDEREAASAKARKESEKAAKEKGADAGPKSEEEEDRLIRERQQSWRKQEGEFLEKVLARACPGWTAKDWEALNSVYWKEYE